MGPHCPHPPPSSLPPNPPLSSIERKEAKGNQLWSTYPNGSPHPSLAQSDLSLKEKAKGFSVVQEPLEDLSELMSYYSPSLSLPKDLNWTSGDATQTLAMAYHGATFPFLQ